LSEDSERKFGRRTFDDLFGATEDPWNYSSHYETTKYSHTLSLIPGGRPQRALEVGCAEGHFTSQLASKVDRLTAVDISALALDRARHRCASYPHVEFEQLNIFEQPLPGPFDLIVCSELLYYARDLEVLSRAARAIADALAPGGALVTAHAHLTVDGPAVAAFDWEGHVAGAIGIERRLLATGNLKLTDEIRTDLYRVQRYVQVPAGEADDTEVRRRTEPTGVLLPEQSRSVVWGVGQAQEAEPRLTTLTYHRVSKEGPPSLERYRLDPEALEGQLRLLWETGYRTVSLDQWSAACRRQGSLPMLPLLLTFDDGYQDFLTHAWPVLSRHGFTALVPLVSDRVGGTNEWDAEHGSPAQLMNWDAVRNLHKQGVRFAAHSATHRRLTRLDPVEATREIWTSKVRLEQELGEEITTFVYPFNETNERIEHLLRGCSFTYALAGRPGVAVPGDNLLELPRIEVENWTTPDVLIRTVAEARLNAAQDEATPRLPPRQAARTIVERAIRRAAMTFKRVRNKRQSPNIG
jgi:peptidoglycan/xylan/chitin deacetylase (PgdA/CDA1 family)